MNVFHTPFLHQRVQRSMESAASWPGNGGSVRQYRKRQPLIPVRAYAPAPLWGACRSSGSICEGFNLPREDGLGLKRGHRPCISSPPPGRQAAGSTLAPRRPRDDLDALPALDRRTTNQRTRHAICWFCACWCGDDGCRPCPDWPAGGRFVI